VFCGTTLLCIDSFLNGCTLSFSNRQEKTLADILASPLSDCPSPLDFLPWEYKQLRDYENGSNIERLAMQWFASVATMLRTGRSLQIVRYEDLVADPEFASKAIMERLGTTASLPQINRLTRWVASAADQEWPCCSRMRNCCQGRPSTYPSPSSSPLRTHRLKPLSVIAFVGLLGSLYAFSRGIRTLVFERCNVYWILVKSFPLEEHHAVIIRCWPPIISSS